MYVCMHIHVYDGKAELCLSVGFPDCYNMGVCHNLREINPTITGMSPDQNIELEHLKQWKTPQGFYFVTLPLCLGCLGMWWFRMWALTIFGFNPSPTSALGVKSPHLQLLRVNQLVVSNPTCSNNIIHTNDYYHICMYVCKHIYTHIYIYIYILL